MHNIHNMQIETERNIDNHLELLYTEKHLPPCARSATSY